MTYRSRCVRWLTRLGAAATAVTVLTSGVAGPAVAAPEGTIVGADAPGRIKDSYIVVFKDSAASSSSAVPGLVDRKAKQHGAKVAHTYRYALHGFAATMSETEARRMAADPDVAYVEQDSVITAEDTQLNPPWNLDTIDQAVGEDNSYNYAVTAPNVKVYVLDTGINITNTDFGGRATWGYNAIDDGTADDCDGHGTIVAGIIGGTKYGVAKDVQLVAVKVLGRRCPGTTLSGSDSLLAGIDWVTQNHVPGQPAVANMSLSGTGPAEEQAIRNSIATGITYVAAAGNEYEDACSISPARMPEVITVAATDIFSTKPDWSNYGSCVSIFAPGVAIQSAGFGGDTAIAVGDGTSFASPHVAGAAALVLSTRPYLTPAEVKQRLLAASMSGMVVNPGAGSPNLLLNTLDSPDLRTPVAGAGAVMQGNDLQLLGVDSTGQLRQYSRAPDDQWTQDGSIVTGVTGTPAAVVGPDGLLYAFVAGTDGRLRQFIHDGTGWHEGAVIGTGVGAGVSATVQGDELHVVATDWYGQLRHFWRNAAGQWSETKTAMDATGTPGIVVGADGLLHVYIVSEGVLQEWRQDGTGWQYVAYRASSLTTPGVSATINNGRVDVVGVGPNNKLRHFRETDTGPWLDEVISTGVGADPAVVTGQDGQLLAFAANSAAGNPPRQFARGGDGDWLEVKGVLGGYAGTAVTLRGDDLEMVSALTSRNMLLWQRTSAGQWSVGVVASGVVVGTPGVAVGPDGLLHAYGVDANGQLRQFSQGSTGWHEGPVIATGLAPGVGATLQGDAMQLVATGTDGRFRQFSADPTGQWTEHTTNISGLTGAPAVTMGPDGVLHAYGVDTAGQLRQFSQHGGWHEGPLIATGLAPGVSAVLQGDALQVVATGTDGRFRQFSGDPTGQWAEHTTNFSELTGTPTVTVGPDGQLVAFAPGISSRLRQFWQSSDGSWQELAPV